MSFGFFFFFDLEKRSEGGKKKEEKKIIFERIFPVLLSPSPPHQSGDGDDVRDALHALAQDVVGEQERVRQGGRVADDAEEAVVSFF